MRALLLLLALLSPIPLDPPPIRDVAVRYVPATGWAKITWEQQSDATTVLVLKDAAIETPTKYTMLMTAEGMVPGRHAAIDNAPQAGDIYWIAECWRDETGIRCLPAYGPYRLYVTYVPVTRWGKD